MPLTKQVVTFLGAHQCAVAHPLKIAAPHSSARGPLLQHLTELSEPSSGSPSVTVWDPGHHVGLTNLTTQDNRPI